MRADIARKLTRGIVASFLIGFSAHLLLLDGLDGFLWSLIFRPSTHFAPGYSWLAFRRVQPGMSRDEVVKLLGEPMEVHDRPTQGALWRYSKSPTDSHYSLRVVFFSDGGVVTRVAHEYYVD
ncbi:outer membrane protein assembly factor BamE domain-containing protein [Myxococcus xanthus]|uniref:Outer membrane protein assembly factor BamE n=1 Tax=Myxococcus xanthus TaxID=34 RepID=A0A7Y4MUS9_MYXXA|nr:outer membrane protein assembly factor BamE [Myxococcus xanthus]NOJ81898.1 outer membrane protein assembly factor BamE [Myxococcus xanthus]NOJ89275.1 outer membrane protein assembly factor BamE [Myxococcus xanthus]